MIALGSDDPTRTICSTLIAEAFHSVPYPILPRIERIPERQRGTHMAVIISCTKRHHSLFAHVTFDYRLIFIKPAIESAFDPHKLTWGDLQAKARGCNGL